MLAMNVTRKRTKSSLGLTKYSSGMIDRPIIANNIFIFIKCCKTMYISFFNYMPLISKEFKKKCFVNRER